MSEQENYLFKVIGSIIMGYGMEKPSEETLVIAHKIIDLVAKDTEERIIKLLEDNSYEVRGFEGDGKGKVFDLIPAIALIKGEVENK